MPFTSKARRRLINTSFLAALAASTAVVAAPVAFDLDIPAGSLGAALTTFERQTRLEILYNPKIVAGRVSPGVKGRLSPDAALKRLVQDTDIAVIWSGPNTITLRPRAWTQGSASGAPTQTARDDPPSAPALSVAGPPAASEARSSPPAEIVVTGTHIRGAAGASPVVIIDRQQMDREGDATVADALARLPQAFGGTATPVNTLNSSDRTGTNSSFGQGINLRGLGANATLVLINGRRMAGTGSFGDFADVSALPTAAIDHVDVLLDGASAIYGSDAVGGVINVITRKDYEGADSSVRIGDDEGGGGASVLTQNALGLAWPGGHALLSYEYQHINRLSTSSRDYTANSDLTALGGTDHDSFYSNPGNILGLNAARTGYVPIYAIPAGTGLGLTPSSFVAGTANGQNVWHDSDISPESDRSAFFVDMSQALDPRTTVDIEGRYNYRHFQARGTASSAIAEVTPKNPYYVSPNGAPYELIGLSSDGIANPQTDSGDAKSYDFSIGIDRDLWRDWRLETYVGMAGDVGRERDANVINSGNLNEALGTTPDNPTTAFSTAADGFYNPYGSGLSNSASLRQFITNGFATITNVDLINVASAQLDGTLFTLPGGPLKGAFGVQYRHEHFETSGLGYFNGTSTISTGGAINQRDVTSAYGELNIPIVGAANAVPGVERLDLSIAGRVEHYDDVGTTANPKIGVRWRPIDDLVVRATYGTSFRAPALSELDQPTQYAADNLTVGGKTTLVLLQYGGNQALKPETATTWTAGVDWTPAAVKGLRLGLTWFDIDFTNEISDPGDLYLSTVLTDPALASLVTRLNPSNPSDLALATAALAKAQGSSAALFPASAYGAIVDARYLNTASKLVRGFDFSGSYAFNWGRNTFGVNASATYLTTFSEAVAEGAPSASLLNTPDNPVNFRGKASIDWSRGPYAASFIVNYVNRYKDPVAHRPIDAWTTCDLTFSWRAPATRGPLSGVVASASIQNLFGVDPPFYDSAVGVGYDSANANPFGRIVALQLAKHW